MLKNIEVTFDRDVSSYFVLFENEVDPHAVVLDFSTSYYRGYTSMPTLHILSETDDPINVTIEYDGYLFTESVQEHITKNIKSIRM